MALGIIVITAALVGIRSAALAAPEESESAPQAYDQTARPFLDRHCLECHSGDDPAGDLRLDQLTGDFDDDTNRRRWQSVLEQLDAGTMPPEPQPRPEQHEVRILADWVVSGIVAAERVRRAAEGRVVLRRLNRVEYENTIRDLLGVTVDLKKLLPPDSSADGFDNVGDALHVSSFLMERYLEAAETALDAAIANGPQPALIQQRYSLQETHQVRSTTESVFRTSEDGRVVMFSSSPWEAVSLTPFYPPDRGNYRFRIAASGFQSSGKPVTYRVDAGSMLMTGEPHLVSYFDAPAETPEGTPSVVEFVDFLAPRDTIRILPYGLASAQAVDQVGADKYDGPGLAVEWIEVEGPLHDAWPPESHRRIFGDLAQAPAPHFHQPGWVEVVSEDPLADADRILRTFARRAFRRPVTDADLAPILHLVAVKLAEQYSFEQAVRVGLTAILVSPRFLFLEEAASELNDFELASRLSYFLWSTMPDEELLTLAEQGRLTECECDDCDPTHACSSTLHEQVERMLEDPKALAFVENFVGQWLGLREIDSTVPSHILYPDFDEMLKISMVRESELFFAELLRSDLSLTQFIDSNFSMLNGRLAKHYGIPDVDGWQFRKVTLPPESHRGGVLTMAGVLKVTANGTHTSPVTRGAWVLENILGTPPPSPPESVAALEPDTRGATTIREQLAKHRQLDSCAGCHAMIDPPGFALESFDVIGGWREHYRTTGNGDPVIQDGRTMPYLQGPQIDPAGALADGRTFRDIDEYKRLLLDEKDQIARALTVKLVTYATGGPPGAADRPVVDNIVTAVGKKNYGLRSLVHEIVQSDLFQRK